MTLFKNGRAVFTLATAAAMLCIPAMHGQDAKAHAAKTAPEDRAAGLWTDSAALANKAGHITAIVRVRPADGPAVEFRYDRFSYEHVPTIERLVMSSGAMYVRYGGTVWKAENTVAASADSTGDNARPPAARVAELEAAAVLAMRAFASVEPNDGQGAVVWRYIGSSDSYRAVTYEMRREKEGGEAVHAQFDFRNIQALAGANVPASTVIGSRTVVRLNTPLASVHGQEVVNAPAVMPLLAARGRWDWKGVQAEVVVDFYYHPAEDNPTADGMPEFQLAEALRSTAAQPALVDAQTGDVDAHGVRVWGIIAGRDFDLTVEKDGAAQRQIAVGADAWTSADDGKTWVKQTTLDRVWSDAVAWPLDTAANGAALRPFLSVEDTLAGGPARRFRVKSPIGLAEGEALFSVSLKDGKPAALISFDGQPVDSNGKPMEAVMHADYSPAPRGVQPPPGAPAIARPSSAGEMLAEAIQAMKKGTWRFVQGYARLKNATGEPVDGKENWVEFPTTQGLFSGSDYDIKLPPAGAPRPGGIAGGSENLLPRELGVGGKVWTSADGGKTWATAKGQFTPPVPWNSSSPPQRLRYEIMGVEQHGDGETWLHIRGDYDGWPPGISVPHFWLMLDKSGKAVYLRRFAEQSYLVPGFDFEDNSEARKYDMTDYTPAKEGEAIKAPEGAK